jgi:LysM repeat protein
VAFEDDRDERASVPDHRHRCYAESRPAPRALAHQQAYCLSSAFPVCPTFQDWARREAARARDAADAAAGAGRAHDAHEVEEVDEAEEDDADEFGARRNPPRDWAAPPPWLASSERSDGQADTGSPPFLSHRASDPGQGLAGSSADWLAGGPSVPPTHGSETAAAAAGASAIGASAAGAGAAGPGAASSRRGRTERNPDSSGIDEDPANGGRVDDQPRRPARRSRAYEQHLGGSDGPDWERPRRYESYPVIKTRAGLPNLSRLGLAAGAIAIAAIALFFLPAILGLGSGAGPAGASPSPSAAAVSSASVAPTAVPAPTAALYTIKKNETLSKIATAHGITLDELLAANPQIKNPNQIKEGQQITIPAPSGAPDQGGSSPQASGSP